jgi:hypothetical protein
MNGLEIVGLVIVVAIIVGVIGFDLTETRRFRGWDR